jgi:hypothetical protein
MIGRRICAECRQKWLVEKIKQVTEERIARVAAEAAAAAPGGSGQ